MAREASKAEVKPTAERDPEKEVEMEPRPPTIPPPARPPEPNSVAPETPPPTTTGVPPAKAPGAPERKVTVSPENLHARRQRKKLRRRMKDDKLRLEAQEKLEKLEGALVPTKRKVIGMKEIPMKYVPPAITVV